MEQRDYIEEGVKLKGSLAALGRYLDQGESPMRSAKNHKCGLPVYACVKLAQLIKVDPLQVIAASELVTEKKEERKAVWLPFVSGNMAHPVAAALIATGLTVLNTVTELGNLLYNS
ncbi:hypothetical protein [Azovibrio restrictus]|uniref:hypothetical protein n=1 Tax=Azovibrio restrictus TaxID=146938 RepID=UPI0026ECC6CE|nr:hypothetical protein [Azovibrio restrictus]MDD3483149.1 hypothetical protein [Azovibrio restrictus]